MGNWEFQLTSVDLLELYLWAPFGLLSVSTEAAVELPRGFES